MKKPILFLSLGMSLLLTSCTSTSAEKQEKKPDEPEKPLEGTVVRKNEGRNTTSEINFKDGIKEGIAREYYSSGKLWKETNYKNGKLDGIAKVYDQQGRLKRTVNYQDGRKHGTYTRYFKSGNPKLEIEYDQELPMPGFVDRDYTGKLKEEPEIVITHRDQLATSEMYFLEVELSEPHKNTIVYAFEDPSHYKVSAELHEYRIPMEDGKGVLPIKIPRGYVFAKQIHFFVQYDWAKGVRVVKEKSLNLAVENTH